jgi:hypothetical protein
MRGSRNDHGSRNSRFDTAKEQHSPAATSTTTVDEMQQRSVSEARLLADSHACAAAIEQTRRRRECPFTDPLVRRDFG